MTHIEESKRNNDFKLAFKSMHAFVVFFVLFANCFGISNGDNGAISGFEDEWNDEREYRLTQNLNKMKQRCDRLSSFSSSREGLSFAYETNAIVGENNYDDCNINSVDQICCDLQWILQQYHFENATDYQSSELCWKSTDSVCIRQEMRDTIHVNQTENNSVSNFDEIVQ